jgi:hypothetical protein
MDTLSLLTLHLARAYGVVIITVALSALLAPKRLAAALGEFERSPGLTFLSALFALVLGIVLVMLHSIWVDFPAILVSLLGWLIAVKGVLLLAAPESLLKLGARASASGGAIRLWGIIALILGALYLAIGLIGRASVSM